MTGPEYVMFTLTVVSLVVILVYVWRLASDLVGLRAVTPPTDGQEAEPDMELPGFGSDAVVIELSTWSRHDDDVLPLAEAA
jgi:hypothetical protein